MIFSKFIKILLVSISFLPSMLHSDNNTSNKIEVLVNEKIITKYDIIQRVKINSILKRIEITDSNYNQLIETVINDLIIEKLKVKKLNEYNINTDNSEFKRHENKFYSSINYTREELINIFDINDINYDKLIELIEIDLRWQKLIYGLYLRVTSVTEKEIYEFIAKNPDASEDTATEILMQKQLDLKSSKLINDLRDEATIEYK